MLVAGGIGSIAPSNAVRYDLTTNTWSAVAPMATGRWSFELVRLPGASGEVLAVGGKAGQSVLTGATERYSPATETWSPEPPLNKARLFFTATALADGRVLVTGGMDASNVIGASAELYSAGGGS